MIMKNSYDWVLKFGEFEVNCDSNNKKYTLEIGYTTYSSAPHTPYLRLWLNDDFIVGAPLRVFSHINSCQSDVLDMIGSLIKSLPPDLRSTCISYAERMEKLKAFT